MRKNLAKHTAKKLPLAKRVLALCFALIFVCSCLLPAFANGTGAELETPGTEVVEAADPGTEPEPMDLYDEPAAVADEPEAMDEDFGVDDEPAAMDDQVARPASSSSVTEAIEDILGFHSRTPAPETPGVGDLFLWGRNLSVIFASLDATVPFRHLRATSPGRGSLS